MKLRDWLREAGKRHSASDQQMIQTMHDHAVSLGADCAGVNESWRDDPEIHLDAAFAEALGMSFQDITNLLSSSLKTEYPGQNTYVWARDVYDDHVVYTVSSDADSSLYQRSYSILDGKVTFGDATKVIAVTNYVPVSEAADPATESAETELTGDLVPLVERAVKKDGTIGIKIIQAGQGSSGYYPTEVLKRDGPKVFTAGLHMHLDHPSVSEESDRPERSVTTIAGTLASDARWDDDGAAGPGLYAEAKVRSDLAPLIEELAPHIGVSIRALGKAGTREIGGKKTRTVEAIEQAKSVDFVTVAGAGGSVLPLIEAARTRQQTPKGEDDMSQEELAEARKELDELKRWKEAQERRERDARLIGEARLFVVEALKRIAMPDMVRDRLTGQIAANPPLTADGALDKEALKTTVTEAAAAEVEYLASVTGGTGVRGMGSTLAEAPKPEETGKRLTEAFARLSGSQKLGEIAAAGRK